MITGIDIIGHFCIKQFSSTKKTYLIGQVKKYTNLITVKEIRELAGAIPSLKFREFSQKIRVYKDIEIRSHTPIRGLFFTSYFFTSSALQLCEKSDIIPFDFCDIICLLISAEKRGLSSLEIVTENLTRKLLNRS
jgi:hypothetical protein